MQKLYFFFPRLTDRQELTGNIPLEMNVGKQHGVCLHKGCYIGQQLVARTHFKVVKLWKEETRVEVWDESDECRSSVKGTALTTFSPEVRRKGGEIGEALVKVVRCLPFAGPPAQVCFPGHLLSRRPHFFGGSPEGGVVETGTVTHVLSSRTIPIPALFVAWCWLLVSFNAASSWGRGYASRMVGARTLGDGVSVRDSGWSEACDRGSAPSPPLSPLTRCFGAVGSQPLLTLAAALQRAGARATPCC